MNVYKPKPLDTSDVVLPDSLNELLERLAENTHAVWALQRIKDGWKFGDKRDDEAKEHPCLVPYAHLPEAEKEYDRNTARETLRAVLQLGYSISQGEGDGV